MNHKFLSNFFFNFVEDFRVYGIGQDNAFYQHQNFDLQIVILITYLRQYLREEL